MMQPTQPWQPQPWQAQPLEPQPRPCDGQDPRGSVDYAPAMRAAPLGWYFPLYFLIQALMPIGFAIPAAFAVNEPWQALLVVGGGGLISALILALLLKIALGGRARQKRFERAWHEGITAQAQVMQLEPLLAKSSRRGTVSRSYRKARVSLAVYLPGYAPYQVVEECFFRSVELGYLPPGSVVNVAVHPADPQTVLIAPLVRGH